MAFVALTAASVTLRGDSGRIYELALTKATAVGFVTFTNDSQTFWRAPENVTIIDGFVGDSINAGDYLDLYVNSLFTGVKYMEKKMTTTVTGNRITSPKIRAGSQIALYHYSA